MRGSTAKNKMPPNQAAETAKAYKLAAMDWANLPPKKIQEELGSAHSHLQSIRQTNAYKEAFEELKQAWHEKMLATPGTSQIRKKISYALGLAVHRVIDILADETSSNKDVIGAGRLIAQMDGRFWSQDNPDDPEQGNHKEIIPELNQAMDRLKAFSQKIQ